MRTLSLHLSAIYTPYDNCSYWILTSFAVLSSYVASYMISVRQTGGLPRASFRFHVTVDTLAFSCVLTATRSYLGLSPIRVRPCWANKKRHSLLRMSLSAQQRPTFTGVNPNYHRRWSLNTVFGLRESMTYESLRQLHSIDSHGLSPFRVSLPCFLDLLAPQFPRLQISISYIYTFRCIKHKKKHPLLRMSLSAQQRPTFTGVNPNYHRRWRA